MNLDMVKPFKKLGTIIGVRKRVATKSSKNGGTFAGHWSTGKHGFFTIQDILICIDLL